MGLVLASSWKPGTARGLRHAVAAAVALATATCSDPAELPVPETGSAASANPGAEALQQVICADDGRCWRKLAADGLHNPANAALDFLQEPATALMTLPPGGPSGNKIDWVAALRGSHIAPRTNIYPETKVRVLDLDIVFTDTKGQPHVVFPHRPHTEWLDCSNCHPDIFVADKGANEFGMLDVLQGEYCGRCHGAVAFPLTECTRCHSQPQGMEVAE